MTKAAPRFWARLVEKDEDFATDLSQAILVSHLDMIKAVLDELGIPNQEGFFDKDIDGDEVSHRRLAAENIRQIQRHNIRRRCCCSTSTTWIGKWPRPRRYSSRTGVMSKEFFRCHPRRRPR